MGQPDYRIKTKSKDGYSENAGVAWKTKVGDGINLRINPGHSLSNEGGSVSITLWPYEPKGKFNGNFNGDKGFGAPGKKEPENTLGAEGIETEDVPW